MTDQNNIEKIVQEAECVAAADEYFKARAWLMDTTDNRRIFEAGFDRAYALLSKLRAPGADERAIDLFRSALAWGMTYGQVLNQKQWDEMREKMAQQFSEKLRAPVACDHQFHFFGDQKERRCNRCNTLESKASAPVAGEAQKPVAWLREKTPGGGVWHRSVSLDEPPTGFIAIDRKTPLYAAPQASEAVRDAALNDAISILINLSARYRHNYDKEGCNSYHEGGSDALDEAEQAIRAALSAQPGAQK